MSATHASVPLSKEAEMPRPLAYNVTQVAVALGVSGQHVRNLISSGHLAAKRTGRKIYILPSELERFLESLPDA